MRRVGASVELPGARIAEAEALWYDLSRWPAFVEGFKHVVRTQGDWPAAGSQLLWESVPAGRGRVLEQVTAFASREGQRAEVADPRIRGVQEIVFEATGARSVLVKLTLDYELVRPGPLGPLTDLFFIRRAQQDALRRTLLRFARELEADRELGS
jgi:hypothetical protein